MQLVYKVCYVVIKSCFTCSELNLTKTLHSVIKLIPQLSEKCFIFLYTSLLMFQIFVISPLLVQRKSSIKINNSNEGGMLWNVLF